MRCNVCGKENPSNVDLCLSCGSALPRAASLGAKSSDSSWETDFTTYFRATWRDFVKSPLVVLYAVCYCVVLVLSLLQWDNAILQLGVQLGFESVEEISARPVTLGIIHMLDMLPGMLTAVGIWITCADGWSREDRPIRFAGLTIIAVIQVIMMILYGILFALILLMSGSAFLVVLLLAALVLYLSWVKMTVCLSARNAARDCMPETRYIKMLAIIQFIGAGLNFVILIGGGSANVLNSIANCVLAALLGGVLLFYKSVMEDLEAKYVQMEVQGTQESKCEKDAPEEYVPAWKRVQMEKENNEA